MPRGVRCMASPSRWRPLGAMAATLWLPQPVAVPYVSVLVFVVGRGGELVQLLEDVTVDGDRAVVAGSHAAAWCGDRRAGPVHGHVGAGDRPDRGHGQRVHVRVRDRVAVGGAHRPSGTHRGGGHHRPARCGGTAGLRRPRPDISGAARVPGADVGHGSGRGHEPHAADPPAGRPGPRAHRGARPPDRSDLAPDPHAPDGEQGRQPAPQRPHPVPAARSSLRPDPEPVAASRSDSNSSWNGSCRSARIPARRPCAPSRSPWRS